MKEYVNDNGVRFSIGDSIIHLDERQSFITGDVVRIAQIKEINGSVKFYTGLFWSDPNEVRLSIQSDLVNT